MENYESALKRSGYLVNRTFRRYLLPTFVTAIAISLNEFVDSLLVAHLLDAEAMAIVNVGSPIMLCICAIYVLMGAGGSTVYAVCVGQRDAKRAGTAFSVSMLTAVVLAVAFAAAGIAFLEPVCRLLCKEEALLLLLPGYARVLFLSAPLIVGLLTLSCFLPAAGSPSLATAINVTANVVNLVCDFVYIRFFHMGVAGAAWATFTGYAVCAVMVLVMLVRKRVRLFVSAPKIRDAREIPGIAAQGGANAINQFGYALKGMFFNALAVRLGGANSLIAFSVCVQTISIMSIGIQAIVDAMQPILGTLFGQRDRAGMRSVLMMSIVYVTSISAALVALFELFPGILFTLYNVSDPAVIEVATGAIRVFMLMFLFRALYVLYPCYARIIGYSTYAILISVADGVALPIGVAALLSRAIGLNGVWLSFPLACALTLALVMAGNLWIGRRSKGRYRGVLLLEAPRPDDVLLDITVNENDQSIADMSRAISRFLEEHGTDSALASKAGLLAEEMAVYTRRHKSRTAYIDVMTRVNDRAIDVEFRSDGTPFNPLVRGDEDLPDNIALIQRMPSNIAYDYMLGMNSTRITFDRVRLEKEEG